MSWRNWDNLGPYQKGDASSNVAHFTAYSTTAVSRLPVAWGEGDFWVGLCSDNNDVHVLLSDQSDATVAIGTPTLAGLTGTTVGLPIKAGVNNIMPMRVPIGCVYLARITTTGTSTITAWRMTGRGKMP